MDILKQTHRFALEDIGSHLGWIWAVEKIKGSHQFSRGHSGPESVEFP